MRKEKAAARLWVFAPPHRLLTSTARSQYPCRGWAAKGSASVMSNPVSELLLPSASLFPK